jgi:hypothetical protein
LWAIEQLQHNLGGEWPEHTWAKDEPPPFLLAASYHAIAFSDLLDLALRVHLMRDIPGIAKVRRDLQKDLTSDRRLHSGVILDVAGLACHKGYEVTLETQVTTKAAPTDVVVTTPAGVIATETLVVHTDAVMRDGMAYSETVTREAERICLVQGVSLDGQIPHSASPEETLSWLAEVEAAAKLVAADGEIRMVENSAGRVAVVPEGAGAPAQNLFSGPPITGGDTRRLGGILRKKAKQAVASGGQWIRADVLDGLWQFTQWSTWTLLAKGEALAAEVRESLADIEGLRGAVLTSGPMMAQGTFFPESQKLSGGGHAIRRTFAPFRVRETIVIPVVGGQEAQSEEWRDMYDAEPYWLDWALSKVGLPPAFEVFGDSDGSHARGA